MPKILSVKLILSHAENEMKILAINGSPRGAKGNTERLVQPFLAGAREAGAETEVIYLKGKKINHCRGCFTCWTKTPGVCVHKDDMPALLEKLRTADVVVFATPLYVFTVSGLMKDFMDRMIPTVQPFILQRGEHFTHPPRYAGQGEFKIVLISNAGFPERHHFSGLEETFRRLGDSSDGRLLGMICCAGGEMLKVEAAQGSIAWYLEAARKAGREVVAQGGISAETQAVLDRPLMDAAIYADMANAWWESQGVQLITFDDAPQPESAPDTRLSPPQGRETLRDMIAGMALVLNPKEAGDLEAVIQFNVTGSEPGHYFLTIAQGRCTAYDGEHPRPTLTLNTPAEVWMAINRGELNGATAMMTGKYSIKGNLGLLMRFNKLFSSAPQ
jgi:multimeric flavodoxin WrbA/putative sterol carrier protein